MYLEAQGGHQAGLVRVGLEVGLLVGIILGSGPGPTLPRIVPAQQTARPACPGPTLTKPPVLACHLSLLCTLPYCACSLSVCSTMCCAVPSGAGTAGKSAVYRLPLIQLMTLSAHYSPVSANVSALLSLKFIIVVILLVYFVSFSVFVEGFKPFLFNIGQKLPSYDISISPNALNRGFHCSWMNLHLL